MISMGLPCLVIFIIMKRNQGVHQIKVIKNCETNCRINGCKNWENRREKKCCIVSGFKSPGEFKHVAHISGSHLVYQVEAFQVKGVGHSRIIEFIGKVEAHSHIFEIYKQLFFTPIWTALGFLFPKHTLISI